MTDHVYLDASRTKLVDKYALGKKYQIPRAEAERLGFTTQKQERRVEPAITPRPKRKYTKRKP